MIENTRKTLYAMVGAPVVAYRRLVDLSERVGDEARKGYDTMAKEGKKFTDQMRKRSMVEELTSRVDFDQIQGRVEKLRDQLEESLAGWRESFRAQVSETSPTATSGSRPGAGKTAAKKSGQKTSTARGTKTTVTKKAPAKKAAAARKTPTRKPTAAKKSTRKAADTKKAPTGKTAAAK